jgi:hypothetical protein
MTTLSKKEAEQQQKQQATNGYWQHLQFEKSKDGNTDYEQQIAPATNILIAMRPALKAVTVNIVLKG